MGAYSVYFASIPPSADYRSREPVKGERHLSGLHHDGDAVEHERPVYQEGTFAREQQHWKTPRMDDYLRPCSDQGTHLVDEILTPLRQIDADMPFVHLSGGTNVIGDVTLGSPNG